jgi:hypothetical protein
MVYNSYFYDIFCLLTFCSGPVNSPESEVMGIMSQGVPDLKQHPPLFFLIDLIGFLKVQDYKKGIKYLVLWAEKMVMMVK